MPMVQNGCDMPSSPADLVFLKLGGSLITHKDQPETPKPGTIARLAREIQHALEQRPMRLLIGHGSGSFGHAAAARREIQHGIHAPQDWSGYVEVWQAAHRLHALVLEAFWQEDLPAISYPPSTSALAEDGELVTMTHEPIQQSLEAGLLPITMGDIVFDRIRGAAIVSTEQVFAYLAARLRPGRILLAGSAPGIVRPDRPGQIYGSFTRQDLSNIEFAAPPGDDVTGGMASKVAISLALAEQDPETELRIFSAEEEGELRAVLLGAERGTRIAPGSPSNRASSR